MKFKWHKDAFDYIRTCEEMHALCREQAEQIMERANSMAQTRKAKYEIGKDSVFGKKAPRVRVSVHPANIRGRVDNQRHNTLLKAVGGE